MMNRFTLVAAPSAPAELTEQPGELTTPALPIARLARFSTDGPAGVVCATLYTQGCPGRCPYCHSARLRTRCGGIVKWDDVDEFLTSWTGFVDMVVFSGGEPTLHPTLPGAMEHVRNLGFRIGLHTSGMFPGRFAAVVNAADWVGFDVKTRLAGAPYSRLIGVGDALSRVQRSLCVLAASGVPHDLRMTMAPGVVGESDARAVDDSLLNLGLGPVRRQKWHPDSGLSEEVAA